MAAESKEQKTFNESCLRGRFVEPLNLSTECVIRTSSSFQPFRSLLELQGVESRGEKSKGTVEAEEGQCLSPSLATLQHPAVCLSLIFQLCSVRSLQTSPMGGPKATPPAPFRPEPQYPTAAIPVIHCSGMLSSTARGRDPGASPSRGAKVSLCFLCSSESRVGLRLFPGSAATKKGFTLQNEN